jgi:hypothetical protein
VVQFDAHVRVQIAQATRRRLNLRHTERAFAVNHLPLKVARVHHIVIDKAERSHPRRCQIKRAGAAQPARARNQHARLFEKALTLGAHVRQDQVPGVTLLLVGRKFWGRVRRGHRHSSVMYSE